MNREQKIICASKVGIISNIFLVIFKALVGWLSGSIAIILDALNNLSDVLSCTITIIGTYLAKKPADKEHPFGHGRIEYFSTIIIAFFMIGAGAVSLMKSVHKIIVPDAPIYTLPVFIVLIVAILTKIVLSQYITKIGKFTHSDALIASGIDARFDAIITFSTFISALITWIWSVSFDGLLGSIISLFIIYSGIKIAISPISHLLGKSVSKSFENQIRKKALSFPEVIGVHDIIMNSYGPNHYIGSFCISVKDNMTAGEIHTLTKAMTNYFYRDFGIILTIGIYAFYTHPEEQLLLQKIQNIVSPFTEIEEIHGFHFDKTNSNYSFDVLFKNTIKHPEVITHLLVQQLYTNIPKYTPIINVDRSYASD